MELLVKSEDLFNTISLVGSCIIICQLCGLIAVSINLIIRFSIAVNGVQ